MTELEVTIVLVLLLALIVWGMMAAVRSAKLKKTGSTLMVAAMFGFAKLLDPRQVDIEEARQIAPRKRAGENGENLE